MHRKSELLFLFFLFASLCTAQSSIKPEWAVFSSPLKWESPPPELHSNTKSARARILVFFPSGEYGGVYCMGSVLLSNSARRWKHFNLPRGPGDCGNRHLAPRG
jgi:hypothetical protein